MAQAAQAHFRAAVGVLAPRARRRFGTLAVAVLACAMLPADAFADGDPASDVLYGRHYYVPYGEPSADRVSHLKRAISKVYAKKGHRVKVAVIATPADLGSVPVFFNKPEKYARFLGTEISSFYAGVLLVVMPNGFGLYNRGASIDAARRALKKVDVKGKSAEDLLEAAARAVQVLSAAGALKWRDVLAPLVFPFTSVGRRGQNAQLRFSPHDDSGYARVSVTIVTRSGAKIGSVQTKLRRINLHKLASVAWRVPADAPKELHFCVVATDAARHRSGKTCGLLHIS